MIRLGFAGDVMLGRLVDDRQRDSPPSAVWGDVLPDLQPLDGFFVNLECCLSTRGTEWQRTYRPFHFRADPDWAVPALQRAGVDYCSLANNHVLDFEEPAFYDTLDALDDAEIAYAGAGRNLTTAFEPAHLTIGGLEIAVVAFTDNTPEYAASERDPGTARVHFDVDDDESRTAVQQTIDRARASNPDLLVASLHWGPNEEVEPPDSFREFGRWLVDEGVDVVHGHSAHIFQGIEVHDGRPICYDTGDFVDDYKVNDDLRNDRAFLFEFAVDEDGTPQRLRLSPTEIHDCAVYRADQEAAAWSRDRMRSLSEPFGTTFERDGDDLVLQLSA